MLKVYSYNKTLDKYIFEGDLHKTDIISYTHTERDFSQYSELNLVLKMNAFTKSLIPENESDVSSLSPIVITKEDDYGNIVWFSFIITRIARIEKESNLVELVGTDFKWFEQNKLVPSNKDYPVGSYDPDSLPDDFAKYSRTTSLKEHLLYAYSKCFTAPVYLTYGRLSNTIAEYRKFLGLSSITVNDSSTVAKGFQADITNLFDFKSMLFELFERTLEVRQYFEDGKIRIVVEEPEFVDKDLLKVFDDVLSREFGCSSKTNHIFGTANPNIDANETNIASYDFTSLEKKEDVSFVSGDILEYAVNTTKTILNENTKDRFIRELEIAPSTTLSSVRAGNFALINNVKYRVASVEESLTKDEGLRFFIDIEEVV